MSLVISARGLVKSFRGTQAVSGIDLAVAPGDRVALLGPNGAGKTTTLLMLLGIITPDEGSVELLGHALPQERSKAMEHVGFAAGYLPLPSRMTVHEVLALFADLYGIDGDRDGLIAQGLEQFGIAHLADAKADELSSGQRTLVGIVKSVLHRPSLLVLDEPTASLDPDVALRVRTGLRAISEEQGTALLVTSHDMVEVERMCDRVVFVAKGHIVADGSVAEITAEHGHESLEEMFIHLASEHRASDHRSAEVEQ
jgi:ABC-2 type transport system ATP-binding protein